MIQRSREDKGAVRKPSTLPKKKGPPTREAPCAFDANVRNFLTARCSYLEILGHTLATEHSADERSMQSTGDYLPSGNLLKRSDSKLYRENFFVQ